MKDALRDIVTHTYGLGFIDLVKIDGNDESTTVNGIADDRSVVVSATFHKPVTEFTGVFGMPNLGKLNTLLNLPPYQEDAKLELTTQERNGEETPVGIHFENSDGDFKNDYRFMSSEIINEKIKNVKFRGANWHVDFEPSSASIERFKYQAQANSEEDTFVAKTEDKNLVFYFGDHSSHAGNFVFQHEVKGELKRGWNWPVDQVMKILNLPGEITMQFSDDGAAQINVNSGLATYEYILPAQQK